MIRRLPLLAFSLLLLALVAPAGAEDWPQFRGPNRDGVSSETGFSRSWPEGGPQQLWRREMGKGFSALSVVGGRIYTMFATGDAEFAACIEASDGTEIWRTRLGKAWTDRYGDGPRSTPTVDGDRVYVLGARGNLQALKTADGVMVWSHDLAKDFGAEPLRWGVATSPLVEGSLLLVDVGGSGDRSIVAFDKKNGEVAWSSQSGKAGYSAPIAFTAGEVRQVVFFPQDRIVSLSPEDGKKLWDLEWKTDWGVNAATPIFIEPDRLFVSSGYDKGSVMLRVKGAAVEELWRSREMKNRFSSSVYRDGYLYGFDEKTFKCVDAATGKTVWQERGLGHGSLIWADGHLIVLGEEGKLLLVEATPEAYRVKASAQVFEGKTWTVPTLVGGRLYLRDEKELMALDLSG